MDNNLTSDAKRVILTKLFDSVIYNGTAISVKLTNFVEAIGDCSQKTRDFLVSQEIDNQTTENDQNNRGETKRKDLIPEICPLWQPLVDEFRNYRA